MGGLDLPFAGEEKDVGTHLLAILRGSSDNHGEGEFQSASFRVRVKKACQGNLDPFGIEDGSVKVHKEAFIILVDVAEGEAVDGKLTFIGGGPEGEP